MAISDKIFEALTSAIKINNTVTQLADDMKNIAIEMRELDRRLIRIETYIEIAGRQRKSPKLLTE